MPKMLLAAGPTMLVRVTASLICVAVTPGTPAGTVGQPGAVGPAAAAAPGLAAGPAPAPGPPAAAEGPPAGAPPGARAAAPASCAPGAALAAPASPAAPPSFPRALPVDATCAELFPPPGATSHTSRMRM